MLSRAILVNIGLFLERVEVKGKEALAWAETYQAVGQEVQAIDIAEKLAKETPPAVLEALDSHG